MTRIVKAGTVALAMALGVGGPPATAADEPGGREIPPAFAPLEYLVGEWNGAATPKNSSQSFRGWIESHAWAWTFARGKPAGMSVAIKNGKVLVDGKLTYDPARKRYRLEGTAPKPRGGSIAFEGALDATGKLLVLDEVNPTKGAEGPLRISVRPNSNFIRYTMYVDRKGPGGLPFQRATEIGLTKKGESLAGGSGGGDTGPKCVVTGGTATMSITHQGQTFPLCCTGCRDEFKENPEKYIKKASLMAAESKGKAKASPAQVSRFEDAFSGDVADTPAKKPAGRSAKAAPAKDEPGEEDGDEAKDKPEPKASGSSPDARAASLLRVGQNLEKSGKAEAALANYRRIVKEFPDTLAAKTAKKRIAALERP